MSEVQKHFQLLGQKVSDRVTGFTGVVTSLSFDLYGCIQAIIHPGVQPDGKMGDQCWFDINRLEVVSNEPVMGRPNFEFGEVAEGKKGPADKPAFGKA